MNWLIDNLCKYNTKIAIIHENIEYTYKQLYEQIKYINQNIIKDIEAGEVVSIISDYSFYSIALLLALHQNKNIIVPITSTINSKINDRIKESFSNKVIKVKSDRYIIEEIKTKEKHSLLENLQDKGNSGLILFSSGTTGAPKAMIHNFNNLVNHYKDKKEKSINMILFLMFDHIGGLNTLLNILSMGATMLIPKTRNIDSVCKLIQDYKVLVLPSSPTFLNLILMSKSNEKYNLSTLRMITYGTESMPESLLLKLQKSFPKTKFLQTFGTSETGITNTFSKSSDSTYMKLDDPALEYKIVENELWLKSKIQVMGYLNATMENFTDDGWFKTGDLVESIDDEYIKIIGRNKEIINVGGQKVLPNEVESIILSMQEIDDVMTYGETNAITGQMVVCDIVLNIDISAREAKKIIRKYCKNKIENYKIPTKVNIVNQTNFSDRFKKIRRK